MSNNEILKSGSSLFGRLIIEDEQKGKERAEYGKTLLKELSVKLTKEFGKGFLVTNLQQMRKFYLVYQNQQTVSAKFTQVGSTSILQKLENPFKLSWSHYLRLIKIESEEERKFFVFKTMMYDLL